MSKRTMQEEHADTLEFVKIFADTESGTSIDKREEFQDMIDKCREGLIDLILDKQMSRFGRNTINTLQAIYELRKNVPTQLIRKGNLLNHLKQGKVVRQ